MEKDLKMNFTVDGKTIETILPVEEHMPLVDFFLSLQALLKQLQSSATTFDIYDLSFQRIAMVGEDNELYIDESYENLSYVSDLFDVCIDTIEVIALGKSSVTKVLQEEKYLQEALDNYEI